MKEIHRKTVDEGVNAMLIKAYREGVALSWDRAEKQQPQCGFSRLRLCCHDCMEGPCRMSPFDKGEERTVCGKDKQALITSAIVSDVTDGQQALARLLAARGCEATLGISTKDDKIGYPFEAVIETLGKSSAELLRALTIPCDYSIKAGMGALCTDKPNVVLYGHFPEDTIESLTGKGVTLSAVCGSETIEGVNALTVYDSQETPLLTGAVDAIVAGIQCIMPAVLELAAELEIPVFDMHDDADDIIGAAKERFAKRGDVSIPDSVLDIKTCNLEQAKGIASSAAKGAVYIGGCGHFSHTQGGDIVKTAKKLIDDGFAVISAGCIGVSLAKAGLSPDSFAYIGPCTNAGMFLDIGGFAVFSEMVHHKQLATAAAFAASGMQVCLEAPAFFADADVAAKLNKLNFHTFGE